MYKIDNKNQRAKIKNLEKRLDFQKYILKKTLSRHPPYQGFQEERKADVREERGAVDFILLGQFPVSSFSSHLSPPNKVILLTKCCRKDQETQPGSDDRSGRI